MAKDITESVRKARIKLWNIDQGGGAVSWTQWYIVTAGGLFCMALKLSCSDTK